MSEMIERVAKALYDMEPIEDSGESIDGFQVTPAGALTWEAVKECHEEVAEHYREQAQAAIAAMREPTEAMMDAGDIFADNTVRQCWQAMIDEALGEP